MKSRRFKSTPKVIGGKVQRKQRQVVTARLGYVVDRHRPGKGYRHVMKKKDIHDFTDLIPEWERHSVGLESIILESGNDFRDGVYRHYHREKTGSIGLTAWADDMEISFGETYFQAHQWHFDMLGVVYEREEDGYWACYFTDPQAKAYMLLHIFLHELGHHIDKLRSKDQTSRRGGEDFAENYANETLEQIWPAYIDKFGHPAFDE